MCYSLKIWIGIIAEENIFKTSVFKLVYGRADQARIQSRLDLGREIQSLKNLLTQGTTDPSRCDCIFHNGGDSTAIVTISYQRNSEILRLSTAITFLKKCYIFSSRRRSCFSTEFFCLIPLNCYAFFGKTTECFLTFPSRCSKIFVLLA